METEVKYPLVNAILKKWTEQYAETRQMVDEFYDSDEYQEIADWYASDPRNAQQEAVTDEILLDRTERLIEECLSNVNCLRAMLGYPLVHNLSYAVLLPALEDTQPCPVITQDMLNA